MVASYPTHISGNHSQYKTAHCKKMATSLFGTQAEGIFPQRTYSSMPGTEPMTFRLIVRCSSHLTIQVVPATLISCWSSRTNDQVDSIQSQLSFIWKWGAN